MKLGSRLAAALGLVVSIFLAGTAFAQTRTITTTGTSTGTGTVHITIEDFNKPGHRDGLSSKSLSPQSQVVIEVLIQAGWDCEQTTQAIFNALLAALPEGYVLTIRTADPCVIIISCKKGAKCDDWNFTEFTEDVPGQNIFPGEPGVPVKLETWGGIKARYKN